MTLDTTSQSLHLDSQRQQQLLSHLRTVRAELSNQSLHLSALTLQVDQVVEQVLALLPTVDTATRPVVLRGPRRPYKKGPPVRCTICRKKFRGAQGLAPHMRYKHP
jgi:hypothetical protein